MFMSKSLSETESRWNTTEKECYAFVYAFKKFEHLISDIPFILRTDHRNLVYINETKSSKILRWKLLIQEYDFHIEHIPGKFNVVSDTFSRVVPSNKQVDPMYAHKEIQNSADPERPYRTVSESLAFLCDADVTVERCYVIDKFEIPRDKYRLIAAVHNSRRGHFGVEKTIKNIIADMVINRPVDHNGVIQIARPWRYMREHVKRFIRCCPCCQKMSQIKTPIETLGFSVSTLEPMERLAIDTIGPLPADKYGNRYIIAISDHFTRWIELYAAQDTSAKEALRALMAHNKTFGQPCQLVSDNGTQYINDIVAAYLELLGTEHVRITAYSHQENSIVERSHKETLRHLRALVFDAKTHDQWSDFLGNVQHIMNNTVHESIGVAPARLIFGGAINLDRSTYLPVSALNYPQIKLSEWAANQLAIQKRMLDLARDTQRQADLRHEMEWRNDLRKRNVTITVFPKGSHVKVAYPHNSITGQRAPHKLAMPWKGPYEVIGKEKSAYIVKSVKGNIHKFSEHLLDVYHIDSKYSDPRQVALDAENMYDIAEVLQIRGNFKPPKRKSQVELLIVWQGYEQDEPTWNVWNSSFNHNLKVHEFLRTQEKKWHWLIPPQYR
jgi:transposase InsO family protein